MAKPTLLLCASLALASGLRVQPPVIARPLRATVAPTAAAAPATPRCAAVSMNLASDLLYGVGCIGALTFAFKNVFDSIFFENEGFRPPMPVLKNPFAPKVDPIEQAENLRLQMQAAIEAQDMEAAFRIEKEIKQLMMETGIRYESDSPEDTL